MPRLLVGSTRRTPCHLKTPLDYIQRYWFIGKISRAMPSLLAITFRKRAHLCGLGVRAVFGMAEALFRLALELGFIFAKSVL